MFLNKRTSAFTRRCNVVIDGILEHIVFESESFMVAKFQPKKEKDTITITGKFMGVHPGESLQLIGKWTRHSQYGNQFQVEKYLSVLPATSAAIERYLGSGLIKGIGPVTAKKIVRHFKNDTLDIIESEPEKLTQVDGIGPKKLETITKAWEEQKEIRNIMMFLQSHDISSSHATKIFMKYGQESIKILQENPYRLVEDIDGIGFLTADKIGQKLGFKPDSILRIREGIVYFLNKYSSEGHVFCPQEDFYLQTQKLLGIDESLLKEALNDLIDSGRIVLEDNAVYLKPFYVAENNLAAKLNKINSIPIKVSVNDSLINTIEKQISVKYTEEQKQAVKTALSNKISVITGGPGTGKTTIIKSVVNIAKKLNLRIKLAAPTGRAAKRLQEASDYEAQTIHRLLEFTPPKGFLYDNDNPLPIDILIIDEASMLDMILANQLFKAVSPETSVILVGDINQLPSVGPGNVLKDIINSKNFPVVSLTQIFRQSKGLITLNAHRINNGEFPIIDNTSSDFFFISQENPEEATQTIVSLCAGRIQKKFGYGIKDIQVLSPMLKGSAGVVNINTEIQKLNKSNTLITRGKNTFKLHDKVMQIKNNYLKNVFNGDIGFITKIDSEDQQVTIQFDTPVTYEYHELDQIVLSYACSVHKSQGSEYPVVIMPVLTQHWIMLQRNLIYTGLTRGKKVVILIGTKKALAIAVKNNDIQLRNTRLAKRLQNTNI